MRQRYTLMNIDQIRLDQINFHLIYKVSQADKNRVLITLGIDLHKLRDRALFFINQFIQSSHSTRDFVPTAVYLLCQNRRGSVAGEYLCIGIFLRPQQTIKYRCVAILLRPMTQLIIFMWQWFKTGDIGSRPNLPAL